MKAEQVKHSDVRPSSPIYLVDPIKHPNAMPCRAGAADIRPDALVWTCFESWARINPWLKKEVNGPIGQLRNGTVHALDGLDHYARE